MDYQQIKKAIIPVAGLGTRFLTLSKVLPKEIWPLVTEPIIQYIVAEAKASGVNQIIFVTRENKKLILDYFKPSSKLEEFLKKKKEDQTLKEMRNLTDLARNISFSSVTQKKPLGDGHALLRAARLVKNEPCAALFADDVVVEAPESCLYQLIKIFKTCQKPIIALHRIPKQNLPSYGVVEVEKIANHLYKIKKIVEKPSMESAPSDLAIVGKYILTSEVFDYLKKAKPSEKGEIILSEVLGKMIDDGKVIYGYEFKGRWLECGNKMAWLRSFIYLALNHPQFGPELKKWLKSLT